MTSNEIIDALLTSLQTYCDANLSEFSIEYESEIRPESELQESMIQEACIGLDEINATVTQLVSEYKAKKVNQGYQFQVYYRMSREQDIPVNVSGKVRDIKDTIVDWIDTTDFSVLTSGQLMYLQYLENSSVSRNVNYATQTITLISYRKLVN